MAASTDLAVPAHHPASLPGIHHKLIVIYRLPEKLLGNFFYSQGRVIAKRPLLFVILPLVVFLTLCSGFCRIQLESMSDIWRIYYPKDKPIAARGLQVREHFAQDSVTNYCPYQEMGDLVSLSVILVGDPINQTSQPSSLTVLLHICDTVDGFSYRRKGRNYTLQDVCAQFLGVCKTPAVCSAVRQNGAKSIKLESLARPEAVPSTATFLQDGTVNETSAFRLVWFFRKDSSEAHDLSIRFVRELFNRLHWKSQKLEKRSTGVNFHLFSPVIQNDEVRSIVKNDSKLMIVTVVLMSVFSIAVSANRHQILRSRAVMAMAGVVTTCLAIGSAIGFLSFLGVPFIQVAFLAPFIMLGIGIDSTFVILFAWAKEGGMSRDDHGEVIGATMRKSFIAVFISNMTAFIAFLVGSFTPYEAVNITCYYLATTTIFLLVFQATFFMGCLSIHQTRNKPKIAQATSQYSKYEAPSPPPPPAAVLHSAANHKLSWIVRLGGSGVAAKSNDKLRVSDSGVLESGGQSAAIAKCGRSASDGGRNADDIVFNSFEQLISNNLPKIVLNNYVRVGTVFSVGVAITLSIDSVIHMKQFINEIGYQPDNSRITQFYAYNKQLFNDPMLVQFVINQPVPYHDPATIRRLTHIYHNLQSSPFALDPREFQDALKPWFLRFDHSSHRNESDLIQEAKETFGMVPTSDFATLFKSMQYACNAHDVLIKDGSIIKSRFFIPFESIVSSDTSQGKVVIEDLKNRTSNQHFEVYFTSVQLMLLERNSYMKSSVWHSIFIALLSCTLITCLLLPDPIVFACVVLTLAATMTTTMGFMGLLGMHYNIGTYILVLLLIGLCIDYISHSGHAYLAQRGDTREEIVTRSLRNIGVPLFNAAMSSIISVSMLGFSSSLIMRNMFKAMMLLFSFSFFYGVVFLPIILSFFGPIRRETNTPDQSDCSKTVMSQSHCDNRPEESPILSQSSKAIPSQSNCDNPAQPPPQESPSQSNGSKQMEHVSFDTMLAVTTNECEV